MPTLTDLQFHRELTSLINHLRDAHTQYTGPKRLANVVASLPFLVEAYGPAASPSYVVTKVTRSEVPEKSFEPGVTLELVECVPFDRAVDLHAEVETGGRRDARRARALESLTFRALGYAPPPDEHGWSSAIAIRRTDNERSRLDWRVVDPGRSPNASGGRASRVRRGINPAAEAVRRAKKLMFNGELWLAERRRAAAPTSKPKGRRKTKAAGTRTGFEDFLTADVTPDGHNGYLRIWSFDVDDDQGFLEAAIGLLKTPPDRGMIIDLRDNPGGFIWAAERMLQLFTPNRIVPTKFALRATPLTVAMAGAAFNQSELGPWASSLTDAAQTANRIPATCPLRPLSKATTWASTTEDRSWSSWTRTRIRPATCSRPASWTTGSGRWCVSAPPRGRAGERVERR